MKTYFAFCIGLMSAALLPAATSLSGPVAGYAASPTGAGLRAILGVPGAFALRPPGATGGDFPRAHGTGAGLCAGGTRGRRPGRPVAEWSGGGIDGRD